MAVHRQDWPRAARLLQDCVTRFPNHPERTFWQEGAADALTRSARGLIDSGELARAEPVIRELAALPGASADVAGLMAKLAQQARQASDLALAERVIADCIGRFPDHADRKWWLAMHGDILLEQGAVAQARSVYEDCIARYPDSPGGYSGLARAAQKLGDTAASAQAMGNCLTRFPQHPERRWWLPFHGNALCGLGAWDEAEAAFGTAVRDYPDEPAGHSGLARVAVHRQDWPRAARLLRDCLTRFPDYGDKSWWVGQLRDCEQRLSS